MDYAALAAKVAAYEAVNGATGNVALAAALNAEMVAVPRDVPRLEAIAYAERTDLVDLLVALRGTLTGADALKLEKAIRIFTSSDLPSIGTSDAVVKAKVEATFTALRPHLIALGFYTEVQVDAIIAGIVALTEESRPFWQSIGFHRELDHGDIVKARGARWEDLATPNAPNDQGYRYVWSDGTEHNEPEGAQ